MKNVLFNLLSVVISLISAVTLMSRPTTGGTLWKPSNLMQKGGEAAASGLWLYNSKIPHRASSLPVQVKSCDLSVVPFKVGEVEEVYIRLCVSGLSVPKKDASVRTDKDGCLGETLHAAVAFIKRSYFMGLSMASP